MAVNSHWVPSCEGVNLITDNPFLYTTLACHTRRHMLQWITDSNHTLAFVRNFAGYFQYKVVMAKSLASMLFVPFKNAFCKFQQCIHSNAAPRPKHTTTETHHVSLAVYQPSATTNETLVHIVCSHWPESSQLLQVFVVTSMGKLLCSWEMYSSSCA